MNAVDIINALAPADAVAVVLLVTLWAGMGWRIDRLSTSHRSVSVIMAYYVREWMQQYIDREARIFDATVITNLRQGSAFFASTAILAVGGVLALAGNTAPLEGVAEELSMQDEPTLLWQIKLLLTALFLTHAFLKFVWSHRIFGYAAVMMASTPLGADDPRAAVRAKQAADLTIRAIFNFNRGLRSVYFALATLGWLAGPYPLIAATLLVGWVLWSREFHSVSRDIVAGEDQTRP